MAALVERRESINLTNGGIDATTKIMEWNGKTVLLLWSADGGIMFFGAPAG